MPESELTGEAPKKSEACEHNREGGQASAIPGGVPALQKEEEKEESSRVEELTPEEQLARYEESLKNDDWGHQPC